MGGTSWSDDHYTERANMRAAKGINTFAYHEDIRTGKTAAKTHATLDPAKLKAGKRECRDSTEHPKSKPVYIGLDVTGSMSSVPKMAQIKLKELLAFLLKKGYLEDPAICISAIGDAATDRAPFQVGQFESGIEIENDLTNLYLEGNGGGNRQESYDLALYFLARKVTTDAWEKRKEKGYAFIICDEQLPQRCKASHINTVFDDNAQADIPIEDLLKEVEERWELYCIVPNMTSHYKTDYQDSWKEAIGERVIFLEDHEAIVETIASCIGMLEENVDLGGLVNDLKEVSAFDDAKTASVTKALAKVTAGKSLSKVTDGSTGLATL